jgi:hypothetical protein
VGRNEVGRRCYGDAAPTIGWVPRPNLRRPPKVETRLCWSSVPDTSSNRLSLHQVYVTAGISSGGTDEKFMRRAAM